MFEKEIKLSFLIVAILFLLIGCGANTGADNILSNSNLPVATERIEEIVEENAQEKIEECVEIDDANEWNTIESESQTIGAFTYDVYASKDGKCAYIYHIDIADSNNASTLRIPEEINGKIVTCIGAVLEEVFDECSEIAADGRNVFGEEVYFEGKRQYQDLSSKVKNIELPRTITDIKECTFAYMSNLENITLNEGITYISKEMCFGCDSLKKVELPITIEDIDASAFSGCKAIENIFIDENSENFKVYDKFVMRKKDNALVYCFARDDNFEIPNTIQVIGTRAFANCKMDNIKIPASVIKIEEQAFSMVHKKDYSYSRKNEIHNITVDKNSEAYGKDGHTIYDKRDGSLVVAIAEGKSQNSKYIMSDKVTRLDKNNSVINYKGDLNTIYASKNLSKIDGANINCYYKDFHFQNEKVPEIVLDEEGVAPLPLCDSIYVPKNADNDYREIYRMYKCGNDECIERLEHWNVE